MARKHFLINLHTPSKTELPSDLRLGEIAVRHNDEAPELLILKDNGEFATFVDKTFVTTITTSLSGEIDAIAGNVTTLSAATVDGFAERYTKDEVDTEVANAVASGKSYADTAEANAKAYSDGKLSAATDTLSKSIEAVAGNVTTLSAATVDGFAERYTKDEVDTEVANAVASGATAAANALASAKTYTDAEIASAKTELSKDIEDVAGDVDKLEGKIDTIIGEDSGMTTRDIVVDELAKQLIEEGADEKLNELKEIAAWIQQHPKDAAEMNLNIKALSAATGSLSTNIETIAGNVADLSGATVAGFAERYTKTEVDGHLANAIASGETAADDALADAKEYSDGKLSAATDTLSKSIEAVAGNVTTLSAATVELAGKAVTSIEITGTEDPNNTESQTVTAKIESNVAKFDFSKMIIDCGTF